MTKKAIFYLTILSLFFCSLNVAHSNISADAPRYDFLANLRTLTARSSFSLDLDKRLIFTKSQAIAHFNARLKERLLRQYSGWALGNVRLLNVNRNEDGFNAFSNGAQAGIDFLNDGGVFAAYRKIDAHYDQRRAYGREIEIGLYKYFFDINFLGLVNAFNLWGSLAFSNFNVDNELAFNSRAIKGGFEVDFSGFMIKPFLGARGGYASNDSANDRDGFIVGSDNYLRAEILVGLKTLLEFKDFAFSLKAYSGFLPIGGDAEFSVKNKNVDETIKAVEEEKFFGGASLLAQWSIVEAFAISLLGGADTDMNGIADFYGNFALTYRFMRIDIKDRSPKPQLRNEVLRDNSNEKLKQYREDIKPIKSIEPKEQNVNERQILIIFDDETGKPSRIIERK